MCHLKRDPSHASSGSVLWKWYTAYLSLEWANRLTINQKSTHILSSTLVLHYSKSCLAALISAANLLEMQNPRTYLKPIESEPAF